MEEYVITVPKQLSKMAANLVRSYALSQFPNWRPFAYRFMGKANLMSADLFVEKPLDIHCNFSALKFDGEDVALGSVVEETYEINSTSFSLSDLKQQSHFDCSGKDSVLMRTLDSTQLTVYFLYQMGLSSEEDNRNLVTEDTNIVFFASRHTIIDNLGFSVTDSQDGLSKITFFGCDEKIIYNSLKGLTNIFESKK